MNILNLLMFESAMCKVFAYENKNKNKCTILPEMICDYLTGSKQFSVHEIHSIICLDIYL